MNKALWIARKNYLCGLIKRLSDAYGGDDKDFLHKHIQEVLEAHRDEKIEEAIECYENLVEPLKYYRIKDLR